MKKNLFLSSLVLLSSLAAFSATKRDYILNYSYPAQCWKMSLPLGNGHMGTMVTGRCELDTLVINEETMWTGGPHDYSNPQAKAHLNEVRQLIKEEKFKEALDEGQKYMIGQPMNLQTYQPVEKVIFTNNQSGAVSNYKRTLNISKSIAKVSYTQNGYDYTREYFMSYPDNVLVVRFNTNSPKGMNMDISRVSEHPSKTEYKNGYYQLNGVGSVKNGIPSAIKFNASMKVMNPTKDIKTDEKGIHVRGAREFVLLYTAATNFKTYKDLSANPAERCSRTLTACKGKSFKSLYERHLKDYSSLFNRLSISLGNESSYSLPTDSLISEYKNNKVDTYLDEMLYQMGRYLTISASRTGNQPMNLEGIWNDKMKVPWDSKWTLNINLPMNYWMTEAANLSECQLPLIDLIHDLYETGSHVAKVHYGCRGFVVHHNTDLWRASAPVDGANWGLWTLGGAWLTRHIWEHYQYTRDLSFLKENYKYLKAAALFFFDYLTPDNDGYLATSPAISFEQAFRREDKKEGRLCQGPTMDNQILRDLFGNCINAAEIMHDNSNSFIDSLKYYRGRLRPTTIDPVRKDIMEWSFRAYPPKVSGQIAPLWGVNPGTQIDPYNTPELTEAAIRTIRLRDPHVASYERSGSWVSGTRIGFWARLHQSQEAYDVYTKLVRENLFPSLLASFYRDKYFQIDANLGVASGIMEMIVQSQRTDKNGNVIIDIFPALPKEWKDGEVSGVRLRGGYELSMKWRNGTVQSLSLKAVTSSGKCTLNIAGKDRDVKLQKGETFKI